MNNENIHALSAFRFRQSARIHSLCFPWETISWFNTTTTTIWSWFKSSRNQQPSSFHTIHSWRAGCIQKGENRCQWEWAFRWESILHFRWSSTTSTSHSAADNIVSIHRAYHYCIVRYPMTHPQYTHPIYPEVLSTALSKLKSFLVFSQKPFIYTFQTIFGSWKRLKKTMNGKNSLTREQDVYFSWMESKVILKLSDVKFSKYKTLNFWNHWNFLYAI